MADVKAFIKKWDGRTLQDDGCRVSKEFHSFQIAFMNAMRKIAASLGGEVVNPCYGHYDMSGFVKRGDRYVYFSYSNACNYGGRNYAALTDHHSTGYCLPPMLIRTAAHDHDWTGGANNNTYFNMCETMIDDLLNTPHKPF